MPGALAKGNRNVTFQVEARNTVLSHLIMRKWVVWLGVAYQWIYRRCLHRRLRDARCQAKRNSSENGGAYVPGVGGDPISLPVLVPGATGQHKTKVLRVGADIQCRSATTGLRDALQSVLA